DDRPERLVAGSRVDADRGRGLPDLDVAGGGVHLDAPGDLSDLDVARSRVEPGLSRDGPELDVAGGRADSAIAPHRADLAGPARRAGFSLAGDLAELHVARAAFDVNRAEAAVALDVGRAGLGAHAGAVGSANLDQHVRAAQEAPAIANVHDDLATAAVLDSSLLNGGDARLVVAERLEPYRPLPPLRRLRPPPAPA